MSKFFSNMKRAVPARARIMIFLSLIIAGASVYFMVTLFQGSNSGQPEPSGKVTINRVVPDRNDIKKPIPGDDIIVANGSPLANQMKEIEDKKVAEATKPSKTGGSSYVQSLRSKNDARNKNSEESFISQNGNGNQTSEVLLAQRKYQRKKSSKQANALESEKRKNRANEMRSKYLDEFMKKEIQEITSTSSSSSNGSRVASISSRLRKKYNQPIVPVSHTYQVSDAIKPKNSITGITSNSSNNVDAEQKIIHLSAGQRFYGILDSDINTDEPSVFTTSIISEGVLNEALFVGMPSRQGESAILEYKSFSLNGKDYSIRAIAFDEETNSTRLSDIVDRHIIERYSKLIIAAFGEGYMDSLVESTEEQDGNIFSVIKKPVPDPSDQLKVAIGNVGKTFVPKFKKDFERPPTVEVFGNKGIGIMLLSGVDIIID